MTSEQETRLRTITAEAFGAEPEEITEDSSPETLGAWTSFSHLTLMAAVEEDLGLTFSMEEMTGVHNYAELYALVAKSL